MKQYYIKLIDENCYLVRYKVIRSKNKTPNEFILTLNEDFRKANLFDENDYIIEICRENREIELIRSFDKRQEHLDYENIGDGI